MLDRDVELVKVRSEASIRNDYMRAAAFGLAEAGITAVLASTLALKKGKLALVLASPVIAAVSLAVGYAGFYRRSKSFEDDI